MANAGALKVAYCHYFSYWLFQQLLLTYKPWFTLGLCSICSVQFVHVVCRGLYVQCVWQAVVIQMHLRSTLTPPILMTVHPVSCRHQTPMLRSVFHVPLCFDLVIIGSLTQCRRASIVLLSGVCRRPSSVVVCNTPRQRIWDITYQRAACDGGPVVLRPVRATPCLIV